jgi:hypothetical protein
VLSQRWHWRCEVFNEADFLGNTWGPERLRTGGWSLLGVMSDWKCCCWRPLNTKFTTVSPCIFVL